MTKLEWIKKLLGKTEKEIMKMNWGALLQFVLNFAEKNPTLVENLLTAILNRMVQNPALLDNALHTTINYFAKPSSTTVATTTATL